MIEAPALTDALNRGGSRYILTLSSIIVARFWESEVCIAMVKVTTIYHITKDAAHIFCAVPLSDTIPDPGTNEGGSGGSLRASKTVPERRGAKKFRTTFCISRKKPYICTPNYVSTHNTRI